jgi:uncharacterized metal-binding protein YceD (DUF177 family)
MPKQELTEQEWSHFFDIQDIEDGKAVVSIEPDEEERQDLARRLNIPVVKSVKAELKIKQPSGANVIHVAGQMQAEITLKCSVSLEEFDMQIDEPIEGWFADKEKTVSFAAAKRDKEAATSRGEVEMMEEHEDPEPVIDGAIDLGELVTQHLSLAIPPYPKKEGVHYEFGDDNVEIDEKSPLRKNPFEALKDWKENR